MNSDATATTEYGEWSGTVDGTTLNAQHQAVELLAARRQSLHDAHHEAMECLGTMIWESQRSGRPPDGQAYIDAIQRRATQD